MFFFFNDTATTEIYTLSLHDALPISLDGVAGEQQGPVGGDEGDDVRAVLDQRAKALLALAPGFFRAGLLGPRAPQVEGAQHGGAHALEVVLDDVVRGARLDILRRRFFVEAEIGRAHV